MAEPDRALGALVVIAVAAIALAFPFVASGYHLYQGAQVLILLIALIGLNLLTGFNGQISLGHGAFFAIGGYGAAILIVKFGLPYLGGDPARQRRLLHRRLPVRFSRAQIRRALSGARHFRACSRDPADPLLQRHRRPHRRLAGPHDSQAARRRSGLGLAADQWLYLVCLASAAALYWAAHNLVRGRVGRALIAIRDQPIAAETMGINAALYKTACFGVSALYAGVAGGLSAIAVGFVSPESFGLPLSLAFLVGIVVGGLGSLGGALFGALFIRVRAQYRRPAHGQFRRRRQGAAGRNLRRAADSGYGRDADWSSGRRAGGGAGAGLRPRGESQRKTAASGGANVAANYEGKGESP